MDQRRKTKEGFQADTSSFSDWLAFGRQAWERQLVIIILKTFSRAQFWSIYWSCKANYKDGIQWAMEQIDLVHRMVEEYKDEFTFIKNSEEAKIAAKEKKVASTMGLEGWLLNQF